MQDHPRRTLLGGIGSTVALAAAGCLSLTDDGSPPDESDDSDETDDDSAIDADTLFEYVPDAFDTAVNVTSADLDRLETAETGNRYGLSYGIGVAALHEWGGDVSAVSRGVVVEQFDDFSIPLSVLELEDGDLDALDLDAELTLESTEHDSGTSYERGSPDDEDDVVALVDDVAILAESDELVDAALDAAAGDATTLLEGQSALDAGVDYFADAGTKIVGAHDDIEPEFDLDADDVQFAAYATTVIDANTLEHTQALALESESAITDELLERFEETVTAYPPQHGSAVTTDTDGEVVTATWTVDLEARRRAAEHNSPSGLRVESVDPDNEYVDVRVTHADPTPVDELTIEIEDEPYDEAIWADGQDVIDEGDTIRFESDRLEPNLSVTVTHEGDGFTSSVTTAILNHFHFAFEHEPDAETVTVRYEDEYPLEGDDVTVGVHDAEYQYGSSADPLQTVTPWDGTLSTGDEVTLEDVEPGMTVVVGWEEPTFENALSNTTVRPPGRPHIDYDYETNTLTVELVFEGDESEPADAYELQIDNEPAETQWSDESRTVSDGSTVVLDDVDIGSNVTVVWGDDLYLGGGSATPSIRLSASIDDGALAIGHEDGPSLSVSRLEAQIYTADGTTEVPLEDAADGTFSEGDSITVLEDADVDDTRPSVSLMYDGHFIASAFPER
ncbi:hypothetical protein [Natronorubrum sp. FCH18a]|uniref:hypothetical protein n=1 Tax=Natronorubrum sp. FCH18a TaxID=3447018 RepID=UPI003F515A8A